MADGVHAGVPRSGYRLTHLLHGDTLAAPVKHVLAPRLNTEGHHTTACGVHPLCEGLIELVRTGRAEPAGPFCQSGAHEQVAQSFHASSVQCGQFVP